MDINKWDSYAGEWDENASTSVYVDHAYDALVNITSLDGLRVLDFGSGTGLLAERIAGDAHEIVALDGSEKMIEQLKKKALPNVFPIADFLTSDLIKQDVLLHQKFDLITASSVCAFVPNYEETLLLLKSLLNPTGIYVQWDWLVMEEEAGSGFTERQVDQALLAAGFKDISLSHPFSMGSGAEAMPVLMAVAKAF